MKKTLMMVTGLIMLISAAHAAAPEFDALLPEAQKSYADLNSLNKVMGVQDKDMRDVAERLEIANLLATDLNDVCSDLKMLSKVANIVSAIPQIRKPSKFLKQRLDKAVDKLEDAEGQARKIEKKIKPVRTALLQALTARDRLATGITSYTGMLDKQFFPAAENVRKCHAIGCCPNLRACEADLEKAAAPARTATRALSVSANEASDAIEHAGKLAGDITDSLKVLQSARAEIADLKKAVKHLEASLDGVKKVLDRDIEVSFKYPDPKLDDPGHQKKANISIQIGDIIEGPSKIQSIMEKKLGKTLWKAAKAVGVDEIVKDFQRKAEKQVDETIKQLNLDFVPEIKGLEDIKEMRANIAKKAAELKNMLDLPDFNFGALDDARRLLEAHTCDEVAMLSGASVVASSDTMKLSDIDAVAVSSGIAHAAEAAGEMRAAVDSLGGDNPLNEQNVKAVIDQLKSAYERQDKAVLTSLFSKQYPDYARFVQSIGDDFQSYRGISLFPRLNRVTYAPDGRSAIANVYWEKRFMLQAGNNYTDTAIMDIKLAKINDHWLIEGMSNNMIFGSSQFAVPDLELVPGTLVVKVSGAGAALPGAAMSDVTVRVDAVIRNKGTAIAKDFEIGYSYTRSSGQSFRGSSSVSMIKPNERRPVSYTFSNIGAFVPGAGDAVKIEIDPAHKIPELKISDNAGMKSYPF